MLKILGKSGVLFLIIMSVYFIVHPQACSNMLAGRENSTPTAATENKEAQPSAEEPQQSITDKPQRHEPEQEGWFNTTGEPAQNGSSTMQNLQQSFSQDDIDYAIASRYVELEREYTRTHPLTKEASSELSYMVMDDFGMSPAEWQDFMTRATASDLFEKARRDLPPDTSASTTTAKPVAK